MCAPKATHNLPRGTWIKPVVACVLSAESIAHGVFGYAQKAERYIPKDQQSRPHQIHSSTDHIHGQAA